MPTYSYMCLKCEEIFEVFHLMSEEYDVCDLCGNKNCITKIPSTILNIKFDKSREKVGNIVKKHIEEIKSDLRKEKKELKSKKLS